MARLAPCPSCRRHVKLDERACPFCHTVFSSAPTPISGDGAQRLPRVAAIALAAGMATTAASCAPPYGQPADDSGVIPLDGGDTDAGVADAGDDAGDDDAGAAAPEYGLPADAGD